MRLLLSILTIILFTGFSFGQLMTAQGSAGVLVQNTLLGNGVTVSNITFNGAPISIGTFTAAGTNLGMASGIVMTTGTIHQGSDGPHGPNNSESSGVDNGAPGYALLNTIAGADTYNAAVLQFDFVPYSDTVRFNYIFASEEYLEFVGSEFNDAFAFFISGPGITGLQNIARLPNGQGVAINNVHSAGSNPFGNFPASNGSFYVNNDNGASIQYDGFTKTLTAESKVECGETYHLIICIADAGDGKWDSGIFLEANSLESDTPIDLAYVISEELFDAPDIVAESCVTTTVTLNRNPNNSSAPLIIPVNISGTATNGVDYTGIPNSITFPAGQSQVQFTFQALQDGITEPQESIIMDFMVTDPCGNVNPIPLTIYIEDIQPVEVDVTGETVVCPGDEVELIANATGGGPPYTYSWSTGETTESILVSPLTTQTYTVSVTDNCLNETATDSYQVDVPVLQPLILNETADITEICPYIPALLESNPSGGLAPYSYQWSSSFDPNLGTLDTYNAIPSTTTTYTIVVEDFCGNIVQEDIVYTITSPPLTVAMSPDVQICPGDPIQISVSSQGGYGQHFYQWWHSGETVTTVWVSPTVTTNYTVSVSDECQTFTVEGTTEVEVIQPTADFTVTSNLIFNDVPIQFQNLSQDAISYEWFFGDGNQSTYVHPSNTYDTWGPYLITLIATDHLGCKDTIQKPLNIEEEWYVYVPNTITPDGNRLNNYFSASTIGIKYLEVRIFNRWGEQVFTSNELRFAWDATYKGAYVPDGTYTYIINFETNSGRVRDISGHVNVLK